MKFIIILTTLILLQITSSQLCSNVPNCLVCELSNKSRCQFCQLNFQLDKTTAKCIKDCGPQYFLNENNSCQQCSNKYPNCGQCDKSQCKVCKLGFKLNTTSLTCQSFDMTLENIVNELNKACNKDLSAWVPSNLANLAEGACKACPSGCKECKFVAGGMQCSSCVSDKYKLANSSCVLISSCKIGQYFDNHQTESCQNCTNNCDECSQISILGFAQILCSKCKPNFIQSLSDPSKCNPVCSKNQYFDTKVSQCKDCSSTISNCAICVILPEMIQSNLPNEVSSNVNGMKCLECSAGYFPNIQTAQCDKTTLTCDENKVPFYANNSCLDCLGCKTCKLLNQMEPFSYQCSDQCETGYSFNNLTKKCIRLIDQTIKCNATSFVNPLTQKCQEWPISFLKCLEKRIINGNVPVCMKCLENYVLDNSQQCIEKPTCTNPGDFILTEGTTYKCVSCSLFLKGCKQCQQNFGLSVKCLACEQGQPQPDGTCLSNTACNENQYDAANVISQTTSTSGTSTSSTGTASSGTTTPTSTTSTTTSSGSVPGSPTDQPLPPPPSVPSTNIPTMPPVADNIMRRCVNCPQSCKKCALISKDSVLPSCSVCADGYQLTENKNLPNSKICAALCPSGKYLDIFSKSCKQCPLENCSLCITDSKCMKCKEGFQVNTSTGKCKAGATSNDGSTTSTSANQPISSSSGSGFPTTNGQPANPNVQACPPGSVRNAGGVCQCAPGSVLQQQQPPQTTTTSTAQSSPNTGAAPAIFCQPETNLKCKVGEYQDATTGKCAVCVVKDVASDKLTEGICTKCLSADKCLECSKGYFLDVEANSCTTCPVNCAACINAKICQVCQPPFVVWQGGCAAVCPSGTLPLVESLYRMNPTLFQNSDKNTLFNKQYSVLDQQQQNIASPAGAAASTSSASTDQSCNPVAINIDGKSICANQKNQLPFTFDEVKGNFEYNGQKITLQCQPCKEKCTVCPAGFFQKDDQQCSPTCTLPYKVFEVDGKKTCQRVEDPKQLMQIVHPSKVPKRFGPYFVQNLYDDLVLVAAYNTSLISSVQWKLVSVFSGASVTEKTEVESVESLPSDVEVDTISKFTQNLELTQKKLLADDSTLTEKVIYKMSVTIQTNSGSTLYDEYSFIVIPNLRELSFNDLDVSSEDWGTTKDSGIATTDEFCAFFNFQSSEIVTDDQTWKFTIQVFPDNVQANSKWEKIYSTIKIQDNYCFTTPYITQPEQKAIVKFTAQTQGVKYTGLKILRIFKPKNFDMNSNEAFKKLNQSKSANDVQLDQTASLAGSLFQKLQDLANNNSNSATTGSSATSTTSNTVIPQFKNLCKMNQTKEQTCSGHGTCYEYGTNIFRCKCDDKWQGHPQCAIETEKMTEIAGQAQVLVGKAAQKMANSQQKITPTEAKQGVETAKQALNLGAVNKQAVNDIQSIIEQSASQIDDEDSANTVLDLIDKLNDIFDTMEDSIFLNKTLLNRRQLAADDLLNIQRQKCAKQNSTRQAAVKTAENQLKNLGGDKSEITLQSQKQQITIGQIKKSVSDLSNSTQSFTAKSNSNFSIELPKSVLPKKGGAFIAQNADKAQIQGNGKLSNKTIASEPLDIKLYDSDQQDDGTNQYKQKVVKNLTEKIKIKVKFDANIKESQKQCLYLDESDQTLKSDGVSYNTTTQMCESTHLTLFVGALMPDQTDSTTNQQQQNMTTTNPNQKTTFGTYLTTILVGALWICLILII